MTIQSPNGRIGAQRFWDHTDDYNTIMFMINQRISKLAGPTLVKVVAVYNEGVAPVGFVDVQIAINIVDGFNNQYPHGTIKSVPYFRLQGGTQAFIVDPSVGDMGYASFCRSDISDVKTARGVAGPASYRQYDWSDGLYFGGFLNGTPDTYVQLVDGQVNIVAKNKISVNSPNGSEWSGPVKFNDDVSFGSSIAVSDDATIGNISFKDHTHSVTSAPGTTGVPE